MYHYTDANGLIGIVSSGKLWCSNIIYLNDAKEWLHGVELFLEMLQEAEQSPVGLLNDRWARAVHRHYKQYINAQSLRGGGWPSNTPPPCFATCFSEADPATSLAQWRAYSKAGSRYAIGFHRDRLEQFANTSKMTLQSVTYDSNAAKAEMARAVAAKLEQIGESNLPSAEVDFWRFVGIGNRICVEIGTRCKHHSFEPEQEVRLRHVGAQPSSPRFRQGASFLVPYFELPVPLNELVHSVWVGPTDHRDLAQASVRDLLSAHRLSVQILATEIPYRESK